MSEKTYSAEYVQKLRDENQELLDEIDDLKKTFTPSVYSFPSSWRLTRRETFILTTLLKAKHPIPVERLYILCLANEGRLEKYTNYKQIEVHVHRLKQNSGVAIYCKRYLGYTIDKEEKQRVFKILDLDK